MKDVDNSIYNELGEKWFTANDNPVALLRAEAKVKNPWVLKKIKDHYLLEESASIGHLQVLDVGCGAGFLANDLAKVGMQVTGVDLSEESLKWAKKTDSTHSVTYTVANAYVLPFDNAHFDAVMAMDFLEHVEHPEEVVKEISRVLKPGGIFLFHTFNRNILAGLIVIKFVEWFVPNTPKNLHVLRLFIKPEELKGFCIKHALVPTFFCGLAPIFKWNWLSAILWRREVPADFAFKIVNSTTLAYLGVATKAK